MLEPAELEHVVDAVRRLGAQPVADALDRALTRWRAPLRFDVTGRDGVGKSRVSTALGLPAAHCQAEGSAADVVVRVEVWPVQPAAEAAIATLDRACSLVVLNKADTIDADPFECCVRLADATGLAVVPMVASLAVALQRYHIQPAELAAMRALTGTPDPTLILSAELFVAADTPVPAAERRELLARWPMAGIRLAIAGLAANPRLDADGMQQLLHHASGIDRVKAALSARVADVQAARDELLLDELERIAARATPDFPAAAAEIEVILDGARQLEVGRR